MVEELHSNTVPNKLADLKLRNLFDKDTVLHLRIPFSFFLLPVFCFAFSQANTVLWKETIILFFLLHLLIYPGSNIYNSYMDEDTESIGGLEKPPPVTRKLYYASIIFDSAGLLMSLLITWKLTLLLLIYIAVSKAYSWRAIRLKKHPFLSWTIVSLFQGGFTFMFVHMTVIGDFSFQWFAEKNLTGFIISSLLVGAMYPLTQVYQHSEDSRRGDRTLSLLLGINGTFIFSALLFLVSSVIMFFYMQKFYSTQYFWIFLLFLLPVVAFFLFWSRAVLNDRREANFKNTMMINKISACCMISCFLILRAMS